MAATRNELATLHVRAGKLKSSVSSRSHRKLLIEDPTACTEQQVLTRLYSRVLESKLKGTRTVLQE